MNNHGAIACTDANANPLTPTEPTANDNNPDTSTDDIQSLDNNNNGNNNTEER